MISNVVNFATNLYPFTCITQLLGVQVKLHRGLMFESYGDFASLINVLDHSAINTLIMKR